MIRTSDAAASGEPPLHYGGAMRTGQIVAYVIGLVGVAAIGTATYALAGDAPCPPICVSPGWLIGFGAPAVLVTGIITVSPMIFMAMAAVGIALLAAAAHNAHQSVMAYCLGGFLLLLGLALSAVGFYARSADLTDGRAALLATGSPGLATVLSLTDTGGSVNDNPQVIMRVRIEPSDGSPAFESTRTVVVSRLAIPRPGQRVAVYYDPAAPDRFAVDTSTDGGAGPLAEQSRVESSAAATPPVDPVERLGKLHALWLAGALTDEEFQRQKAKLDL